MFDESVPSAPAVDPLLNLGCGLDVPTGKYIEDATGMPVLNGGVGRIHSIIGPGNTYKTELEKYIFAITMARYGQLGYSEDDSCLLEHKAGGAQGLWYDSENSFNYSRLAKGISVSLGVDVPDEAVTSELTKKNLRLTKGYQLSSDGLFAVIRDTSAARLKSRKKGLQTAFYDESLKQYQTMMPPIIVAWDSLTESKSKSGEAKFLDKGNVGDSDKQTMFMQDGLVKTQIITSTPNVTSRGDIFIGFVAHLGKEGPKMDTYAPSPPKLSFSKAGTATKGVPEKFGFINYFILEITSAPLWYNSSKDRSARYPLTEEDRRSECKSLMRAIATFTRNKTGPSGPTIEFAVEQGTGVLPSLTEFNIIHSEDRWGMTGNDKRYSLSLLPEVELTRTTVRPLINEIPKLRRALTFTSELFQEKIYWNAEEKEKYYMHPEELYATLLHKGYDMDILLDTRDYWCFREHEKGLKPYLSTGGLVKMAKTDWVPEFYPKAVAAKKKAEATK